MLKAEQERAKIVIFDDGLQEKTINYDLKIVCFNSKKLDGNGFVIPAGPLRERLDSIKNYDVALINGKTVLLSTFDFIYDSLGIKSNEENEFKSNKGHR